MTETAMTGEIEALCETLRDDLPLRIEYRMQAADALARLTAELAEYRDHAAPYWEARALAAEEKQRQTQLALESMSARALRAEDTIADTKETVGNLVSECLAEFTLDGAWVNDGQLVKKSTVEKAKALWLEKSND